MPLYLGKTILLYYILVKRLLENKPTVLQNDSDVVYIFDDKGCHVQKASWYPYEGPHPDMWALVDLGQWVQRPARFVHSSSFFVIMASSPTPARWIEVRTHRGPISFWFMKPFSLAELIQASVFFPQQFVFCHLCDIPVVNFNRLISKRQILKPFLTCTGRQPVIVTVTARPENSVNTVDGSATKLTKCLGTSSQNCWSCS